MDQYLSAILGQIGQQRLGMQGGGGIMQQARGSNLGDTISQAAQQALTLKRLKDMFGGGGNNSPVAGEYAANKPTLINQ